MDHKEANMYFNIKVYNSILDVEVSNLKVATGNALQNHQYTVAAIYMP